jgi:hypothetical protein
MAAFAPGVGGASKRPRHHPSRRSGAVPDRAGLFFPYQPSRVFESKQPLFPYL